MIADPKPGNGVSLNEPDSPVFAGNSDRPEIGMRGQSVKMQTGMERIVANL